VAANPFDRLRARSFFAWLLATLPAALLATTWLARDTSTSYSLYLAWLYGLVLIWAACQFEWLGIRARALVGRLPADYPWLPTLAVAALVAVFSWGAFYPIYYPLSFAAPEYVRSILNEKLGLWGDPRLVFLSVVGAPVAEELLFRGVLLHRWRAKWDLRRAILLSSALFAIMHHDVIGAFVFGCVMCLLYLRSGTLLVPMACHALNNAVCEVWGLIDTRLADATSAVYTVDEFRADAPIGLVCLILSTPFLFRFISTNWPNCDLHLPYFRNQDISEEEALLPPEMAEGDVSDCSRGVPPSQAEGGAPERLRRSFRWRRRRRRISSPVWRRR
jgi:membrane protease YdiL (CAAX protease family)